MKRNTVIPAVLYAAAIFALIADSAAAVGAAQRCIAMCLGTVIPSLFPMCVLSGLLTDQIIGRPLRALRPLQKLCKLPNGSESIYLAGLLGGYPIGAKLSAEYFRAGILTKEQARRMLAFCNNAGPAFIFGLCTPLFTNPTASLCLWIIQICAATLTAFLLPSKNKSCITVPKKTRSVQDAVYSSTKTMAFICGWIILFQVIGNFLEQWFLFALPKEITATVKCVLELSTGTIDLHTVNNEIVRFIICSGALSLGGICILMQTASVTEPLGVRSYVLGKLIQTPISCFMAFITAKSLYCDAPLSFLSPAIPVLFVFFCVIFQKSMAFFKSFIYNTENKAARSFICFSARK